MAEYSMVQGEDQAQAILEVEGKVTSVDWEALREFCLHAFAKKEAIVLNLEKVSEYDFSLTVFVCLLRRTLSLLGKQMTIVGRREEFVCLYSKGAQCSNIEASARCWCESLFGTSPFV